MEQMTAPDLFNSYWIIFRSDQLLLRHKRQLLTEHDLHGKENELLRQYIIAKYDGKTVYCAEWRDTLPIPPHWLQVTTKQGMEWLGSRWYSHVSRAVFILHWDKNHRYCGRCAAITVKGQQAFEKQCPVCSLVFYPRISPSVIVLVEKGDYLLMARSPHFSSGLYGLIAGFVDAGENLEETLHREIMEEVGIRIKDLRYVGSQAWPFPDSLMIAFRAQYESGEICIDPTEIEAADWYHYNAVPDYSTSGISISKKLIDEFILEKKRHALL